MAIEPFSPARHGAVIENMRMKQRSGVRFLIIGIVCLVLAVVFFNIHFRSEAESVFWLVGMWFTIVVGLVLTYLGLANMLDGRNFNARVRELEKNGLVTRGSITAVRHRYVIFGSTLGTRGNRYTMVMDTGWYYKVTYSFEDDIGRLRTATGFIPDLVGAKRHADRNQQIILDQNLPRVGQRVDVLFDPEESVILRIVNAV